MKAICVTESRQLEVREILTPTTPPSGHILVDIASSAINHGDKAFLSRPTIAAGLSTSLHNIWGASASGRVRAIGDNVPAEFAGRNVALYRSLTPSPHIVGLWSEQAVVPYTSALILPESVAVENYCGSLVNAMTGYAFLEEMAGAGHKGVIVTAGASATGLAVAAIARRKHIPLLALVRSKKAHEELHGFGVEHVLDMDTEGHESRFATLAAELGATAVFDGLGGEMVNRIAAHLPVDSTVWCYGFLGGATPISISPALLMMKRLTLKGFSNFNSKTVKDPQRLNVALAFLAEIIADPMFRTRHGKTFSFDRIEEAIAYEAKPGAKASLAPVAS